MTPRLASNWLNGENILRARAIVEPVAGCVNPETVPAIFCEYIYRDSDPHIVRCRKDQVEVPRACDRPHDRAALATFYRRVFVVKPGRAVGYKSTISSRWPWLLPPNLLHASFPSTRIFHTGGEHGWHARFVQIWPLFKRVDEPLPVEEEQE